MKMDENIKKDWVEALRSGKYAQGVGTLCRDGKYCCLGVLADTQGWLEKEENDDRKYIPYMETDEKIFGGIPNDKRKMIGLSALDQGSLIELNDQERYSFDWIAYWIEENL